MIFLQIERGAESMYFEKDQFDIECKVKDIVYSDSATFFRIIRASVLNDSPVEDAKSQLKNEEVIHLTIPLLDKGDVLKGRVEVQRSPRYGYYLTMVGDYQISEPTNKKELEDFLIRKIKGCGKKTARLLVEEYGMDVMTSVLKDEDSLTKLGISKGRSDKLRTAFSQHQSFDQLATFLYSMNLPMSIAVAIYDKLGNDSLNQIQQNPYMISGFDYVSFTHADIIAYALKKDPLSPNRIRAGIISFIESRMEQGDLCVKEVDIYSGLVTFLNQKGNYQTYDNDRISKALIKHTLDGLLRTQSVKKDHNNKGKAFIYLKKYYAIENRIVNSLEKLLTDFRPAIASASEIEDVLNKVETGGYLTEEERLIGVQPPKLAKLQRQAVFMALESPISVLTGGPGTGKTHTVNTVVQTLKRINPSAKIALLAPTGKAAKRMSEMTNMPSMTIHRKLNLSGFGSNEGTQTIEEDFVIADEASMVDAELFSALVSNLGDHTRVLMVGDIDQLPSIGPGLILKDLIQSKRIPVTMLTEVFRQAQNSQIVTNAHKLIDGKRTVDEDGITIDHDKGDMYFIKSVDAENLRHLILKSIERQIEGYNRDIADICVLSPMRVGGLGTVLLNEEIQARLNPPSKNKQEIVVNSDRKMIYREGDRVINLVNNMDKEVMNGETGYISSIHETVREDDKGQTFTYKAVEVTFPDVFADDKVVEYTEKELQEIELAYAISIHKSQGSEFPVVITPVHQSQERMLSRNLIYTAWTRTQDVLIIVGDEKELDKGIERVDGRNRVSLLKEKIQSRLLPID